jgi:glycine cleavage system H protein
MKEEQCPFLEETTVTFCKAFPMRKMIPVDKSSSLKGVCNSAGFHKCMIYKDRETRTSHGESHRGFLQRPDYYLHPRHGWVSFADETRSRAKVGIDDLAQKLLGKVDRISLPSEGTVVRENTVVVVLHSGSRSLKLAAPLDGVVQATNPKVAADPSLVNRSPFDEGWLLSLSVTGDGYKRLLHGGSARSWFEWEVERLHRSFLPSLGATAADGGESVADIGSRLDESQWVTLATLFFG